MTNRFLAAATRSALAALIWLAMQASGFAHAAEGSDPNSDPSRKEAMQAQARTCADRSELPAKRIASCTSVIQQPLPDKAAIAKAYLARAQALQDSGNVDGALQDYDAAIANDASDPVAYFKRGNIHLDRQQYDAAFGDYSESLKRDPNQSVALYNRSIAAQHLRRFDTAEKDQQQAQELASRQTAPADASAKATETAASQNGAPAAQTAPTVQPKDVIEIRGYRRTVVDGQVRYCRTEAYTGSRTEKTTICRTMAQLQKEEEDTRRFMQNAQGGSAVGHPCPMGSGGISPAGGVAPGTCQ